MRQDRAESASSFRISAVTLCGLAGSSRQASCNPRRFSDGVRAIAACRLTLTHSRRSLRAMEAHVDATGFLLPRASRGFNSTSAWSLDSTAASSSAVKGHFLSVTDMLRFPISTFAFGLTCVADDAASIEDARPGRPDARSDLFGEPDARDDKRLRRNVRTRLCGELVVILQTVSGVNASANRFRGPKEAHGDGSLADEGWIQEKAPGSEHGNSSAQRFLARSSGGDSIPPEVVSPRHLLSSIGRSAPRLSKAVSPSANQSQSSLGGSNLSQCLTTLRVNRCGRYASALKRRKRERAGCSCETASTCALSVLTLCHHALASLVHRRCSMHQVRVCRRRETRPSTCLASSPRTARFPAKWTSHCGPANFQKTAQAQIAVRI